MYLSYSNTCFPSLSLYVSFSSATHPSPNSTINPTNAIDRSPSPALGFGRCYIVPKNASDSSQTLTTVLLLLSATRRQGFRRTQTTDKGSVLTLQAYKMLYRCSQECDQHAIVLRPHSSPAPLLAWGPPTRPVCTFPSFFPEADQAEFCKNSCTFSSSTVICVASIVSCAIKHLISHKNTLVLFFESLVFFLSRASRRCGAIRLQAWIGRAGCRWLACFSLCLFTRKKADQVQVEAGCCVLPTGHSLPFAMQIMVVGLNPSASLMLRLGIKCPIRRRWGSWLTRLYQSMSLHLFSP